MIFRASFTGKRIHFCCNREVKAERRRAADLVEKSKIWQSHDIHHPMQMAELDRFQICTD